MPRLSQKRRFLQSPSFQQVGLQKVGKFPVHFGNFPEILETYREFGKFPKKFPLLCNPTNKCSLLWLANWPSALWLAEHHKHASGNVTPLTIITSFSFQVSFISSSPKVEQSCVTDTVMMLVCICSTQASVKTISDGLYTLLWCDPVPLTHKTSHTNAHTHTHTHTHTTRYVQNSAFEQSIANTWTNNKTYLQSLIQKCQIVRAKSELTLFFF